MGGLRAAARARRWRSCAPLTFAAPAEAAPELPAGSQVARGCADDALMVRAVALTLLLVLAFAAPAGAAPSLVQLGSFTSPTWAGSPAGDTRRVFVTERVGLVRLILDGTVQTTPFIDLTGITLATS